MKYRKIMVPTELPDKYKFRAMNNRTGEILESTDLAALFRKIAEDMDAYYYQLDRSWTLDTLRDW